MTLIVQMPIFESASRLSFVDSALTDVAGDTHTQDNSYRPVNSHNGNTNSGLNSGNCVGNTVTVVVSCKLRKFCTHNALSQFPIDRISDHPSSDLLVDNGPKIGLSYTLLV